MSTDSKPTIIKSFPGQAVEAYRLSHGGNLPAGGDVADVPGMLGVVQGVATQTWPHTMDAQVWAQEWMKMLAAHPEGVNVAKDEGMMLAWFANAIMAGYDTAQSRAAKR